MKRMRMTTIGIVSTTLLAACATTTSSSAMAEDAATSDSLTSNYRNSLSARRYARVTPRRELAVSRAKQKAAERHWRLTHRPRRLTVPEVMALKSWPRYVTFGSVSYRPYRTRYMYDPRYGMVGGVIVSTPSYVSVSY